MILNPRRLSSRATKNASRQRPPAAPVHRYWSYLSEKSCFPGRWRQISLFQTLTRACTMAGRERAKRASETSTGDALPTPIPEGQREYPEPVPRWVAEREGTRFVGFVSTGEWRDIQERRKKQKQMMAHGATLMGLHFVAEQLVSTTHSVALFAGLTARMVWLRRARRRRGAPRESFPRRHPLLSEPLF